MQRVHLKFYFLILFFWSLSNCSFANALNLTTSINIESIDGYGFELHDIELSLDSLLNKEVAYQIKIGSAVLPENAGTIRDIFLQCHQGIVSKNELTCEDGELSFNDSLAKAEQTKFQFHRKKNGDLNLHLGEFSFAQGTATLTAEIRQGLWSVRLKSVDVLLAKLRKRIPTFPRFFTTGSIKSDINFLGDYSSLTTINGNALLSDLSFSNDESTLVGEQVSTKITFVSMRENNTWKTQLDATTFKGELYFDPVFIDANASAKDLYGNINWQIGTEKFQLTNFHYQDPNSVHIVVNTILDYEQKTILDPIDINIRYAAFPNTYNTYLQPFLLDTNAADLTTKGRIAGEVQINEFKVTKANLNLGHLSIVDNQNRFSILNLNGGIGWGENYANKNYKFKFDTADIYKLRLEESEFKFVNNQQSLVLEQPVKVPLLDGSINIETFKINHPGKQDQSIAMDISLTPVSMSKLSTTLGWPEMNGNLSGYAPKVTYKKGDIEIGGALLVRGFGGTTTILNLSAEDLFSVTPKLSADLQFNNLDLRSLTETFSFGEITGKMSGSIKDLKFVSWSPIQFDAWFGTPEDDNSKHRISQTAVDNLTQVGNGASNILSKSFLKFFDSFGYDKLGLGCKLKNNICKMRGVDKVSQINSQGFYIVKGSGVPRIDIVGFTDEVSWPVLTARLKRVVSTKDVIVN